MNLIPGAPASDEFAVLEQLTYQTTMYLPLNVVAKPEDSIATIIQKTQDLIDSGALLEEDAKEYSKYISELVDVCQAHPELATAEIGDLSWEDDKYPYDGMVACTFTKGEQVNVCFRGTPGGSWVDNADGMVKTKPYKITLPDGTTAKVNMSHMQYYSVEYMGAVGAKYDAEEKRVNLSGHSKGANLAQLNTMLFSKYINNAYSFYGQSFPPEVQAQLMAIGETDALEKLFGFNADNDYVNALNSTMISSDHLLFFQTPGLGTKSLTEVAFNHYILSMLQNGNLTDRGAPGPVSKTAYRLTQDILSIEDPELRNAVCYLIMGLLQEYLSKEPVVEGKSAPEVIGDSLKTIFDKLIGDNMPQIGASVFAGIQLARSNPLLAALVVGAMGNGGYDYINQDNLIDYLMMGEPAPDAAEEFLKDHDFETEQEIADYLQEHTENGKLEYLVRGALLRCRHGTHARRLNLLSCHGVYIATHPVVHEANCVAMANPIYDNITSMGVCNAPVPPPTETVEYLKDVPRDATGAPRTDVPPNGHVTGRRCQPEIVGRVWLDAYPKTRIVDNGDLDALERDLVTEGGEDDEEYVPKGRSAITTLSFLVCRYGGLIEPYNSGQNYESDAEELQSAAETQALDASGEDGAMREVGGTGDIHGSPIQAVPLSINGQTLSESAMDMVGALAHIETQPKGSGRIITYNWHNIEYALNQDPSSMTQDEYAALSYIYGTMATSADIEKFINLGIVTTKEIPILSPDTNHYFDVPPESFLPGGNIYAYECAPNEVLSTLSQQFSEQKKQGVLDDSCRLQAEIMNAVTAQGTEIHVTPDRNKHPIQIESSSDFGYSVTIPNAVPGHTDTNIVIPGPGSTARSDTNPTLPITYDYEMGFGQQIEESTDPAFGRQTGRDTDPHFGVSPSSPNMEG